MLVFLLIFVGAPLAELYLMIQVGTQIGALATVGLCLFTAALGGILVRWQGLGVVLRVRALLDQGELPAVEVLEGALLLVTGVLLLLPGFITDTLGFIVLVPRVRRRLIIAFLQRRGVIRPVAGGGTPQRRRIIDADCRRED